MSQLQLLKPKQIAERLNCSLANVYALIGSGKLPAISVGVGGKGLRVADEDFQTFIQLGRLGSGSIQLSKPAKPRQLNHIKLSKPSVSSQGPGSGARKPWPPSSDRNAPTKSQPSGRRRH
jgi:excisionase family DNA binding protein